jgi:alcohol dehydrogenase (cytochrome c)
MFRILILAICTELFTDRAPAQTGKRQYETRCVGCHGGDGLGGGHGPAIAGVARPRAISKTEVMDVIRKGIPDRGMPAFQVSVEEANALADYVMSLKARAKATSVEGPASLTATVRLRDGRTIDGILKNESNFDLQLLSTEGKLYLLTKDQVAEIVRSEASTPPAEAPIRPTSEQGVSFEEVAHPKPGTWPTYDGNLNGNRFSPLSQINTGNVNSLAPKWMFTLKGASRALQVTPVVVDGVMYVTWVNEAYALDARSGREIWHFSRPRSQNLAGDAAGGINRGVAVRGDRVFMVTDNAHLLALHRFTGRLLWDIEMADSSENYGSTSAPLVVNDLVIAGLSGGDEGARGFLSAYKISTGERVWRFWTIPARGEPGAETWIGRALEHGCGSTWFTGTYDSEARILYWPTGNPCPDYNGDERRGDNLYTDSVVALDPDSGKLKWYYQFTPHDVHDWDAAETPMLVNAEFGGQPRKLLLQGNRNGFFYVLDRLTGKLLLAEPFVKKLTWAKGIGADGRPQLLPGNEPTIEGQLTCPAVAGAANWPSSAYDSTTGLFYMFAEESCNIYTKNDEWWQAGKSFYGGGTRRASREQQGGKFLKAIDIQTGKTAWEIPNIGGGILGSGLMATAGGLIFYGDGYGAFVAADARNGEPLWHFDTSQNFKAGPMTYTVDDVQYIGMAAGSTILAFTLR